MTHLVGVRVEVAGVLQLKHLRRDVVEEQDRHRTQLHADVVVRGASRHHLAIRTDS